MPNLHQRAASKTTSNRHTVAHLDSGIRRTRQCLVVEQVLGNWRVRDKHGKLWDLHAQAQKIALRLKSRGIDVQIKHIPRAENQVADRIVTDLLDERLEKKRGY